MLAGCGGMMGSSDAIRDSVDDAIHEDAVHLAASRTITTLPSMMDETDRHTTRMIGIMGDMRTDMTSMQHCADFESMMDLRDGMRVELDSHATTMHAIDDVGAARREVELHVATMNMMLGDMGSMLDSTHCGGW
ncbi:MAG TPA: hypothetical protein VFQ53_14670 [Kofleriaceae bacterium]|nr:hypothetical protein [Kofleriaceae bacterium]